MSHFYTSTGVARHFVPKKGGAGNRPTTIADARKEALLPSATTIIRLMEKPALSTWKLQQVAKAAWNHQFHATGPALTEKEYIDKMVLDSEESMLTASDFGTKLHARLEQLVAPDGTVIAPAPETDPAFEAVKEWLMRRVDDVIYAEKHVLGALGGLGYAGKFDLFARVNGQRVVIDFKTRTPYVLKSGPKLRPYWDSDCVQLAAYAHAIELADPAQRAPGGISLIVASDGSPLLLENAWSEDDMRRGLNLFESLLTAWSLTNDYYPPIPTTYGVQTHD